MQQEKVPARLPQATGTVRLGVVVAQTACILVWSGCGQIRYSHQVWPTSTDIQESDVLCLKLACVPHKLSYCCYYTCIHNTHAHAHVSVFVYLRPQSASVSAQKHKYTLVPANARS